MDLLLVIVIAVVGVLCAIVVYISATVMCEMIAGINKTLRDVCETLEGISNIVYRSSTEMSEDIGKISNTLDGKLHAANLHLRGISNIDSPYPIKISIDDHIPIKVSLKLGDVIRSLEDISTNIYGSSVGMGVPSEIHKNLERINDTLKEITEKM